MVFILVLIIAFIIGFVILGYYKSKKSEYYYFRKLNNWKSRNKKKTK